ncbi:MAG: class I SAM-dependent methyltransferase [Polyangiaceae bacterium]
MTRPADEDFHTAFWRAHDAVEARLTASFSERMVGRADLRPGQRVLDVACGRGEPTFAIARAVGAGGSVVAFDTSRGVLTMAEERAVREGVTHVTFLHADAMSFDARSHGPFDAATCRWALASMPDPGVVLAHVRTALVPGAPFVVAVWAEPDRVAYHDLPRRILAAYRPLPPVDVDAPGSFRYGDVTRLVADLRRAGFDVETTEEHEVDVFESDDPAAVIAWTLPLGMAPLLESLDAPSRAAWERDFADALRAGARSGPFRLGGVSHLVTARARS